MKISLIGYMASGKSTLAKKLAEELEVPFIDLDLELELRFKMTVSEYINSKGELAFRKYERDVLLEVLQLPKFVLSVGGGTPCYYNNIEELNRASTTVYLDVPLKELTSRLKDEKNDRPLVAHLSDQEMPEFVAKHLFERSYFYNQANYTIRGSQINVDMIKEVIK